MKKKLMVFCLICSLTVSMSAQAQMEQGIGEYTIQESADFVDVSSFGKGSTQEDWAVASQIVQVIQRPRIPSVQLNVVDAGAKGDGVANDLPVVQGAIDKLSAQGGGKVIVPKGTYFCKGPVVLKSCIELHLEEGATLLFSPEPADYLPVVRSRWEGTELMNYSPLVYAYGLHDIAITGKGTIDGNADSTFHEWTKKQKPDQLRLRGYGAEGVPLEERVFGEGTFLRPSLVEIDYCERVLLEDYTATNSPFWIHHLNCSNHVQVRGLNVDSMKANNDGVDVESCKYVVVEENKFHTGDDSVVIKSGRDYDGRQVGKPSKYVVVRKNDMGGEDGIALGSEMSGGIAYVFFEDNDLRDGVSAVRFKANLDRGATCEHVRVRNMRIANFQNFIWFQLNYPGELGGNFPTLYNDLVFEDITVESIADKLFEAHAPKGYPLENVVLKNITVKSAGNNNLILENVDNLRLENVLVGNQRMDGIISSK